MQLRRVGNSDLLVSEVGLGCNNFGGRVDAADTQRVVDAALDCGINFFDTADVYGERRSEVFLGEALGARRQDVVIATKFGSPMGKGRQDRGGSRHHVRRAVEASLERLGTDYIDLYQMHLPDVDTPIDETLSALDDLVREGKVRYIGHSNFAGWQIADAHWVAATTGSTSFVTAQNHYSLIERAVRHEVLPACERFRLGMLPYFPLASGLLTGKYRRDEPPPQGSRMARAERIQKRSMTERNFDVLDRLSAFAEERGHTILDLAFAWLLSQPVISSVIAGATTADQVAGNVQAAKDWRLTPADMSDVKELL